MTDHNNNTNKVVVIGGGYAGTVAANHLRVRADVDITLVNPRPKFVERIRLHQHLAGNYDPTVDYGTLLGEGVRLVVDSASRIDTASRTVQLASGRSLYYDYVIYAVGSTGSMPNSIPGAAEFAYPIAELEHAQRLRAAIDTLHPNAWITVVGAGLTGTETAAELARPGAQSHPGLRWSTDSVVFRAGSSVRRQVAGQTRRHRPRCRRRCRGPAGRGGVGRRCGAPERADHLGRRFRRA